ncbi:MAG: TolC family protein [Chlamydiota bacterium]
MTRNEVLKFLLFNGIALLFTGCCVDCDPSYTGAVSPAPACEWKPKCLVYKKACARGPSCMQPSNSEPLNIGNMIDIALWNNPDTYQTWSDARAAAFNVGVSESILYPELVLNQTLVASQQKIGSATSISSAKSTAGGAVVGNNGESNCAQNFDFLISALTLEYLLFDFGGRCAVIEAARQALYAANWSHNWEVQTVVYNVLHAYYNHLDAVASYVASQSDLEDAYTTLDAAEKMHQAGVTTIADVLQAKANYSGLKLKVEKDYSDVQTTMGKLARELGLPANTELKIEILPEDLKLAELEVGVEELMDAAKEYRPDLSSLQALLLEKEAYLRLAKAEGKPNIIAGGDIEDDYYLNNNNLNSYVYNAALKLEVPIFSGFYHRNRIKQARAEVQAACAKLQSKEYDILLEVLEAYYDYQTAVSNYAFSEDFLDSSIQNYEVANANYKHGTGTILELLTAQKTLADARAQKIDARTLWLTSLANIAYQTGTIGAIENGHSCGFVRR